MIQDEPISIDVYCHEPEEYDRHPSYLSLSFWLVILLFDAAVFLLGWGLWKWIR